MSSTNELPLAIFLMGPTASGKTDFAIKLCKQLPCDIISVDSALVYKGLNIGTAKPDEFELAQAPHRLINLIEPHESYSVADFRRDALLAMNDIAAHGRIPLLVGGTMLYFRGLQYGLSNLPPADKAIRAKLLAQAQDIGWSAMHQNLQKIDPVAAQRIHENDPQRLQRALEVFEITGKPLSQLQQKDGQQDLDYRLLKIVKAPNDRAALHERIAQRFHLMIEQGFENEVRRLLKLPEMNATVSSLRAVGYRQMVQYLEGDMGWDEMVERGIIATRQLAKRQFTWLRAEKDAVWLDQDEGIALDWVREQCD